MKTKTIFGKCLLLAMAAVLLMTVFASCSAGSQTGAIDSSWTSDDDTAVRYFSRIVPMSAEAHEKFVAASRGYNMSAEGFDDSKVGTGEDPKDPAAAATEGVSIAGARDALTKYYKNEKKHYVSELWSVERLEKCYLDDNHLRMYQPLK